MHYQKKDKFLFLPAQHYGAIKQKIRLDLQETQNDFQDTPQKFTKIAVLCFLSMSKLNLGLFSIYILTFFLFLENIKSIILSVFLSYFQIFSIFKQNIVEEISFTMDGRTDRVSKVIVKMLIGIFTVNTSKGKHIYSFN